MWIDRQTYDALRMDYVKANEECRVLNSRITAMDTTIDWFRVRVTQLEMERAQLLFNYTGVKIPTPVITKTETDPEKNAMTQIPNFTDVGDAEAAKLGIGWNDDGTLNYGIGKQ